MFKIRRELTKEDILKRVSELDLFRFYIPSFKRLNVHFSSEIRKDSTPSCMISLYKDRFIYKDFGDGFAGDVFSYLMKKYSLNFYEVLRVVSNDLKLEEFSDKENLNYYGITYREEKEDSKVDTPVIINIKKRDFTTKDKIYWKKYCINEEILDKYRVFSVESYTIYKEDQRLDFKIKGLGFAYWFKGDYFKIYQPFNKEFKWVGNVSEDHINGYEQLPKEGELCIITKAMKEVMLWKVLGYNACAPQSECLMKEDIIQELKKRFKRVIIWYDLDEGGKKFSKQMNEKYNLKEYFTPEGSKNITDYVEKEGIVKLKEFVNVLNANNI